MEFDKEKSKVQDMVKMHNRLINEKKHLEVIYQEQSRAVFITADNATLQYLQTLIQTLIDSNVQGKHFDLDQTFGLEGNVDSLTVIKKQ